MRRYAVTVAGCLTAEHVPTVWPVFSLEWSSHPFQPPPSLIGKEIFLQIQMDFENLKVDVNGYFVHSAGVAKSFGMEGKAGGGARGFGGTRSVGGTHCPHSQPEWPTEKQRLENKRLPFVHSDLFMSCFHAFQDQENRINSAGSLPREDIGKQEALAESG